VRILPEVTLKELLISFREVLARSDMYAHHHVQMEPLSVRQRMSDVLTTLMQKEFADFTSLFDPAEGKRGVVVTFLAVLELLRESLVELVQSEPFAPIHIKSVAVEGLEKVEAGDGDDNEEDVLQVEGNT
jgi:segregation and condensation protein A